MRVIDFGIFLAGPWASKVLADLGAEVIKVEAVEGEPGRSLGPICASVQRGKKCLAVDLKTPEGQAIVHQLVRAADIVHHNLRVGVAERIGMGYEQLRALNPRLIYCHSSGYGTRGPKALYPTFEPLHSAFTGILHENAGEGNPPLMYLSNMDLGSGYLAAAAMLMALIERARSGEGQFIECPQTAAALTCISEVYRHDGVASPAHYLDPAQTGRGPLDRLYETRAGWIALAAEDAWDALLDAIGRPDLARDPRFAAAAARRQHAAALASELEAVFRTRGAAEWAERLDAAGVPAEIAREYQGDAFLHGPANLAAGLVAEYEHLEYGRMREVGQLIRFSETPGVTHNAGPVLGEHTFEILGGLGYTPAEIRRLKEAGVVTWSPLVEPGSPLPLGEG